MYVVNMENVSEEDNKSYFLQPANEYIMADKIKQANKELYEDFIPTSPRERTRKVTFAEKLVEYCEPKYWNDDDDVSTFGNQITMMIPEKDEMDDLLASFAALSLNPRTQHVVGVSVDEPNPDASNVGTTNANPDIVHSLLNETVNQKANSIDEEICEEILCTDSDNEVQPFEGNEAKKYSPQRRMVKQATFDYDMVHSLIEEQNTTGELLSEDVEDDKLSVIVASYLPNDFQLGTTSLCDAEKSCSSNIRRKNAKSRSTVKNITNRQRQGVAVEKKEEGNIPKFNYKICCENRNAVVEKLPRYTGHLSEYGLSREQLERRAHRLRKKELSAVEQILVEKESKERRSQDNERAFDAWLQRKLRFPLNKTRNMFDKDKCDQTFLDSSAKVKRSTASKSVRKQKPGVDKTGKPKPKSMP